MKTELIVALDVDGEQRAKAIIDELTPEVTLFKVGSVLFTQSGPSIIHYVMTKACRVFLDLKWHDIPHTVQTSVESGTNLSWQCASVDQGGVFMMTVHAQGTKAMLTAAAEGAKKKSHELGIPKPLIVGVTVLTSEQCDSVESIVLERAQKARDAGLDGVVCSVQEAAAVRKHCGKDFIIVTPGIRSVGYTSDDQKRVATIEDAVTSGANFIVVGRPIIGDKDPKAAARRFLKELQAAN